MKDKFAGITQQLQNKFLSHKDKWNPKTPKPFCIWHVSGSNAYVNGGN